MFIGRAFPTFQDNSQRLLGFDLAAALQPGEIPELALPFLTCVYGSDPQLALDPNARFVGDTGGPCEINGTQVAQGLVFNDPTEALVGNRYAFGIAATTQLLQTFRPWAYFTLEPGTTVLSFPGIVSNAAQVISLPTPGPKFTLPTLGGYADQGFPTANQGEQLLYGFDFSPALSPGETIGAAQAALSLLAGTDAVVSGNPLAYFVGQPVIAGNICQQMIAWPTTAPPLGGNLYRLDLVAKTSFNQAIATWSTINIGVM